MKVKNLHKKVKKLTMKVKILKKESKKDKY